MQDVLTTQAHSAAEHADAANRQIAEAAMLTQRTIEQYLTSVYRKLGVSRRHRPPEPVRSPVRERPCVTQAVARPQPSFGAPAP